VIRRRQWSVAGLVGLDCGALVAVASIVLGFPSVWPGAAVTGCFAFVVMALYFGSQP
jgi:hypothetical protein